MNTTQDTSGGTAPEQLIVAARIGNGTKAHPATAIKTTKRIHQFLSTTSYRILQFNCNCTGTANGHSAHKARFIAEGIDKVDCSWHTPEFHAKRATEAAAKELA